MKGAFEKLARLAALALCLAGGLIGGRNNVYGENTYIKYVEPRIGTAPNVTGDAGLFGKGSEE